jgi:arylsulfatase A-like enzyme
MTPIAAGIALAGLLVLASGCGKAPRPNVVILLVDTLAARHVGAWGSPYVHTPHLDRLARRGTQFAGVRSPSPWTLPSTASLLTGRYPASHGATNFNVAVPEDVPFAPELFADAGYATAAFVSQSIVGTPYGFQRGFGHFDEELAGGHRTITSEEITHKASTWLSEYANRSESAPFFLLCHYFDPHWQYRAQLPYLPQPTPRDPETGKRTEEAKYLSEVGFTDRAIGRLIATLEELRLLDSSIVLFTADHGESFGSHGHFGHTENLYEELLLVPCVLARPDRSAAHLDAEPRSLIDVLPTLLDLCGLDDADGSGPPRSGLDRPDGREIVWGEVSWKPYVAPGEKTPRDTRPDRTMRSLMAAGYKVIHDLEADRWELFDLEADPAERVDLSGNHPELLEVYRRLLEEEAERAAADRVSARESALSDDVVGNLRALGYVD